MTRAELGPFLYRLDVPPHLYRVDGTHSEQATVLAEDEDAWVVFVSERGDRCGAVSFESETDACTYFLGRLFEDLAVRGRVSIG